MYIHNHLKIIIIYGPWKLKWIDKEILWMNLQVTTYNFNIYMKISLFSR